MRMKFTIQSYQLVRFIDLYGQALRDKDPDALSKRRKWLAPTRASIEDGFRASHPKYSADEVANLFRHDMSEDYLEPNDDGKGGYEAGIRVKAPRGLNLIKDNWPLPYWGLMKELWRNDGSFAKAFILAVVTFLGGGIIGLATHSLTDAAQFTCGHIQWADKLVICQIKTTQNQVSPTSSGR